MAAVTDRREFILGLSALSAFAAGGCLPMLSLGSSSEKRHPRVAMFGIEGRGYDCLLALAKDGRVEIAAVCDPDYSSRDRVQRALICDGVDFDMYAVPFRTDYRRLLADAPRLGLAAAVVSLPDHVHAPIATGALKAGLHAFVQAPLARTLGEFDDLANAAADSGRTLAVDLPHGRAFGRTVKDIRHGLLGDVSEVHVWTGPHGCPFGKAAEEAATGSAEIVPEWLNWNAWLAVARERPYRRGVVECWRGLRDFGCGSFGDDAVRAFAIAFFGLELGRAYKAELIGCEDRTGSSHPSSSTVALEYPERDSVARGNVRLPAARVVFHTGGRRPPARLLSPFGKMPEAGCLIVGSKGALCASPDAKLCKVAMAGETEAIDAVRHPALSRPSADDASVFAFEEGGVIGFIDAVTKAGSLPYSLEEAEALSEGLLVALAAESVCADGESLAWDSVRRRFDRADANLLTRPSPRTDFAF